MELGMEQNRVWRTGGKSEGDRGRVVSCNSIYKTKY